DDSARQHDDEDRRAIAGIDEGVVEPARFAIRPQVEEARIELALSATRAAAGNAAECALGEGGRRLIKLHIVSFPSPLVGEGGSNERSSFETGEGSVSADRDPSSAFASRRHLLPQGEKEKQRGGPSDRPLVS